MKAPFFIGIDIGTQGARVVLMDCTGNLAGSEAEHFPLSAQSRVEQSPDEWWDACLSSLYRLIEKVKTGIDLQAIRAVAVTSTSGTVIPLDKNNRPLNHAIMYSDNRSAEAGKLCSAAAMQYHQAGYTGFNSSSGLSKMVWYVQQYPEQARNICKWIHAADYITGKLSGCWAVTDYTNALKSGYDLQQLAWPDYLYNKLPLKKTWLPEVVPSGTPVGTLIDEVASRLGLGSGIRVVAGITDGCASQVASGAVHPGNWNTTIGTTMVLKGVTREVLPDPENRFYSHRHPEGYWMPGGAGNIGADWVSKDFSTEVDVMNNAAKRLIPTGLMAYPLVEQGERFPFIAPGASGFLPADASRPEIFAASMEGVAYVERYAYSLIQHLSGEKVKAVFTAGGASNSEVWLAIRSSVLNLPVIKMKHVTGAVGAAILAASKTHFTTLTEATECMAQIDKTVLPDLEMTEKYNNSYHEFIAVLRKKGYINNQPYA